MSDHVLVVAPGNHSLRDEVVAWCLRHCAPCLPYCMVHVFGPSLSPRLLCVPVLVWNGDKRVGEVSEHYFQGLRFVFGFVSHLRFGGGSRSGEALEPLGTAVP